MAKKGFVASVDPMYEKYSPSKPFKQPVDNYDRYSLPNNKFKKKKSNNNSPERKLHSFKKVIDKLHSPVNRVIMQGLNSCNNYEISFEAGSSGVS